MEDLIIREKSETTVTLILGKEHFRINKTPDSTWDPVMDRTMMDQRQLSYWLSVNGVK
jgi:hypothetical protein